MHMISDEELELLKEGNRDGSICWALAAGGVGVGLAQNLLNAGLAIYSSAVPDVIECALGLCATILLSSAVACYFTSRHVRVSVKSLVEAVKTRTKETLPHVPEAGAAQTGT
jgi:hypothetical protein